MIAKSKLGKGFKGTGRYLEFGSKSNSSERVVDWSSSRNLPNEISISEATTLMQATANQNRRVKKPLYHLSISWDPNDSNVDRALMESTADNILKELSLQDNQVLIISHDDTKHKHIHLMVNRINPETLKATSMSHDYTKIQSVLRNLELENNHRKVQGTLYSISGEFGNISQEEELRKVAKDKELSFKELATEVATPFFKESESWEELADGLETKGLHIEKRGRGIVLTDNQDYVKCSSINRDFSLNNLEKRFGSYEQEQQQDIEAKKRQIDIVKQDQDSIEYAISGDSSLNNLNKRFEHEQEQQQKQQQDIEAEGRRIDTRVRQEENRRAIERDIRVDSYYERRGFKECGGNKQTDKERGKDEIKRGFKRDDKDFFNSFSDNFIGYDSNNGRDYEVCRKVFKNNDISRLEDDNISHARKDDLIEERKEIWSDIRELRKKEDMYYYMKEEKVRQQEWQIKKDFSQIFSDPQKAEKKFEVVVKDCGIEKATNIMSNSPKEYGSLKGISVLGIENEERKEALEKAPFLAKKIENLDSANSLLKERSEEIKEIKEEIKKKEEKENRINIEISKRENLKKSHSFEFQKKEGMSQNLNFSGFKMKMGGL